MRVVQIISGGQTGADQGALLAAEACGLATGGWAPRGWRTEAGPAPMLGSRFGLKEHPDAAYPPRTKANVLLADATLVFGRPETAGCHLTIEWARVCFKPLWIVRWPREPENLVFHATTLRQELDRQLVRVLNVAGNRESTNRGIGEAVRAFLVLVLEDPGA